MEIYSIKAGKSYPVKWWTLNNKFHREYDLPFIRHINNKIIWCKYGKLHRDDDKPAAICPDGFKFWYKNGERDRI